jgi:polar amino acid transport system substrate-binding protein
MQFSRILICAVSLVLSCQAATADALDEIKKRGSIIIITKSDYNPWGFTNADGTLDGMEPELARDIAKRLNVKLVLVPSVSSNRIPLLNEKKGDLIFATLGVTEERKKQVAFIEPYYYASMIAILTKANSGIGGEKTLKGRKICAVAGNLGNASVSEFAGGDLVESKTLPAAEEKLRSGECEGVSFDDVVLLYQIRSEAEKWKDYDISLLLSVTPAPWGLAVPLGEKDGRLAKFLSATVMDWHRKGTLLASEKKWIGDNSMALKWLSEKVKMAADGKLTKKGSRLERDRNGNLGSL